MVPRRDDTVLRRRSHARVRLSWLRSRRALTWAFIGVHAVIFIALSPVIVTGGTAGDLPLYRSWAMTALERGVWPGLDFDWIYPVGALLPVVLPDILGAFLYQLLWLLLLTATDFAALWVLTDRGRRAEAYPAAWWYLLIFLLLSPVAALRLEGFTAPLVVIALTLLARRPAVSSALLTLAAWIKVWPAAVLLAAVAASTRRSLIAAAAALSTLAVVIAVWMTGELEHVLSFVTAQSDRALQLEAPLTTPWLWMAIFHVRGTAVYHNATIATREVIGPGSGWAAQLSTPLMFAAIAGLVALVVWTRNRVARSALSGRTGTAGTAAERAPKPAAAATAATAEQQLVLVSALALTTAFIVFNKVGSPQYMLWLTPIVTVGMVAHWNRWRTPAVLLGVIAVLTTLVFPIFYRQLADLNPAVALGLAARNVLLVVVLGWAVRELVRIGRGRAPAPVRASAS